MEYARKDEKVESSMQTPGVVFGVKNPAIFFDILCNRMYGKPLQTSIQEYLCNARDSHREMGLEDIPIKVVLPSILEPTLLIQDFGVGLSRERIADVFVFLGESTKTGSNLQTGGFGIGAKSGWAYSSSFGITTVYDGDKRTYIAFMGEGGVGNLDLLSEETVDEPNGTIISLPIKIEDIDGAIKAVLRATALWPVQPIVKPEHIWKNLSKPTFLNQGTGWGFVDDFRQGIGSVLVVNDGIPYPCPDLPEVTELFKVDNHEKVLLMFNTGDIDLAVNRESIMVNEKTLESIRTRAQEVCDEALARAKAELDGTRDIQAFFRKSSELAKSTKFIKNYFPWKGIKVRPDLSGSFRYDLEDLPFRCIKYYMDDDHAIRKDQEMVIFKFAPTSVVVYNDSGVNKPPTQRLKSWMKEHGHRQMTWLSPQLQHGIPGVRYGRSRYSSKSELSYNYVNGEEKGGCNHTLVEYDHVMAELRELGFTPLSTIKKVRTGAGGRIQAVEFNGGGKGVNLYFDLDELEESSDGYVTVDKDGPDPDGIHTLLQRVTRALGLPSLKVLVKHSINARRLSECGVADYKDVMRNLLRPLKSRIGYDEWSFHNRLYVSDDVLSKLISNKACIIDPQWDEYMKLCEENSDNKYQSGEVQLYTRMAQILKVKCPRVGKKYEIAERKVSDEAQRLVSIILKRYPLINSLSNYRLNRGSEELLDLIGYMNWRFENQIKES